MLLKQWSAQNEEGCVGGNQGLGCSRLREAARDYHFGHSLEADPITLCPKHTPKSDRPYC